MRTFKVGDLIEIGSAKGEIAELGAKASNVCVSWSDGSYFWISVHTLSAMMTPPNTTTDIIGDVQVTVHEPVLSPEVVSLARKLYLKDYDKMEADEFIGIAINFYNAVKNYKQCGTEPKKESRAK